MKTKHTPGPWETADPFPDLDKRACVYWQIIRDQNNNILAEVKGNHYGIRNVVAEANTKLIAAAPEQKDASILLYKLCKTMANMIDDITFNFVREEWNNAMTAHENAIKKATE